MSSTTEVKNAIREILKDRKSYKTSLNYAVGYCSAALSMSNGYLKAQIPYILNNITHWRNPVAKEVRQILKDYKCED